MGDRLVLRGRRGLAQLAPPVPLRLRRVGIRHHVAVQPDEALHRLLLLARHGLEPEASDVLVGAHKMKRDKGVFEKSNFVLCMEATPRAARTRPRPTPRRSRTSPAPSSPSCNYARS